jgi:2'-5' RNA ligase
MPSATDGASLTEVVTRLSQRFGTPLFVPHLTMKGDSDMPLTVLEAAIDKAAAEAPAFSEAVTAIETSDAYFRSFYARFVVSPALAGLKRRFDAGEADAFMPHVSLLYGPVAPEPKAAAANEIARELGGREVRFDRLCVVASGQDVPVAQWRIVATARLC